jgi:hypothetical protein
MIGIIKGHLTRILEMRRLLYEELNTVMQEVALIVNMRPLLEFLLWRRGQNGRLLCRSYIGPLHRVAKRLWEIQKIKKEFWEEWTRTIFQNNAIQYIWRVPRRDIQVRDVVLWKDETATGRTYKYASN